MRRFSGALIGVVLASAAGCASAGAPASTGHGHLSACVADALVLRPGPGVVPMTVVLGPGAAASVLVAKYRCDLGIAASVAVIGLTLPVGHGQVFTAREPTGVPGPPGLSYCRGGPRDPGQLITVSPIEPTALTIQSLAGGPASPWPCSR
jgi:hypothetical protein